MRPMRVDHRLTLVRLLTTLAIVFVCAAHGRDFAPNAMRGSVKAFAYPKVQIGDIAYHMTPASKIFNDQNMIIMPSAMPNRAEVVFNLDINGHIRSLWLLTPDEVKRFGSTTPQPAAPR